MDHLNKQENARTIVLIQACLMLGIVVSPFVEGFRPPKMPDNILDWIGALILLLTTTLVLISFLKLKKTFTVKTAIKNNTKLSSDFPFNFSRNPMYVGGLLMCFSWSLLQRSVPAFVMTLILSLVLNAKIKIEEKNLELVFGDEYRNYKASVRRFL